MLEAPRVRYAPSPTGEPHIGNIRTALFNWLFARRHGGKFVVRVEDTDQERLVPGALEAILEGLEWLDIDFDEGPGIGGPYGPYLQSQRLQHYREAAEELVSRGFAYRCYCSVERLAEMRKEQSKRGVHPAYDGRCRDLTERHRADLEAEGRLWVVRFAMPRSGSCGVDDLVRGRVDWQNELLEDFVILKSDGFPTYHLAVVVDDHLMNITHVLRAEEWLPSTPRHLQLYRALDYPTPKFGHLPMILGPDREKLSKRHGATSILEYRDMGYLPEAMLNFMALLGWSLDDKTEVMPRQTLVDNFSVERVGHSGAIFDQEKLSWMNGVYIRDLPPQDLAETRRSLPGEGPGGTVAQCWVQAGPGLPVEGRSPGPAEGQDAFGGLAAVSLLLRGERRIRAWSNAGAEGHGRSFGPHGVGKRLGCPWFRAGFRKQPLEELLRSAGGELGLSPRQFFGTLRVAVTGRNATPPLFETIEALGRELTLLRVRDALERLADKDAGIDGGGAT